MSRWSHLLERARLRWPSVRPDWPAISTELLLLSILLTCAIVPRLVLLGAIPPGFQGDEADFALEGRRILQQGNIGVFTGAATGTPAGTFYWIAAVFWAFGESVYTVRLSYALLGIVTIPIAYLAFRVMLGRTTGFLAALLLSVSAWHLHYSRIAHVAIGWPLVEVATLFALFLALKHRNMWLFALAGIFMGCGIYVYAAYSSFAIAVGALIGWLAITEYRRQLRFLAAGTVVMLLGALFSAYPLASYYREHPGAYLNRLREYSVTRTPEYHDAGKVKRARILIDRERDFVKLVTSKPIPDNVDGAGLFPLVNRVMLGLLVAGGAICFWRWRRPANVFLIIGIVVIATGPALEIDFPYRRSFGMVPLLCAVAALPLALAWEWGSRHGFRTKIAAGLLIAAVVAWVGYIDLHRYFTTYDDSPLARTIFAYDMTAASEHIAKQPSTRYIYFVFNGAPFSHEIRQFLAPNAQGEDRSEEWGKEKRLNLVPDRSRDVVYILFGKYLPDIATVERDYPGGSLYEGRDEDGNLLFEAYYLPRQPSAGRSATLGP